MPVDTYQFGTYSVSVKQIKNENLGIDYTMWAIVNRKDDNPNRKCLFLDFYPLSEKLGFGIEKQRCLTQYKLGFLVITITE